MFNGDNLMHIYKQAAYIILLHCTMTSSKIKGTACSVYHCLPAMYTVAVVYGSYTLV